MELLFTHGLYQHKSWYMWSGGLAIQKKVISQPDLLTNWLKNGDLTWKKVARKPGNVHRKQWNPQQVAVIFTQTWAIIRSWPSYLTVSRGARPQYHMTHRLEEMSWECNGLRRVQTTSTINCDSNLVENLIIMNYWRKMCSNCISSTTVGDYRFSFACIGKIRQRWNTKSTAGFPRI